MTTIPNTFNNGNVFVSYRVCKHVLTRRPASCPWRAQGRDRVLRLVEEFAAVRGRMPMKIEEVERFVSRRKPRTVKHIKRRPQ